MNAHRWCHEHGHFLVTEMGRHWNCVVYSTPPPLSDEDIATQERIHKIALTESRSAVLRGGRKEPDF